MCSSNYCSKCNFEWIESCMSLVWHQLTKKRAIMKAIWNDAKCSIGWHNIERVFLFRRTIPTATPLYMIILFYSFALPFEMLLSSHRQCSQIGSHNNNNIFLAISNIKSNTMLIFRKLNKCGSVYWLEYYLLFIRLNYRKN